MRIAITGAAGFIGSNLSRYLMEKGYEVIPFVRSSKGMQTLLEVGLEGRVCDVTNRGLLNTVFKNVDVVIHLAALFNHPEAFWNDYYRVNVDGTKNVLEAAMECDVNRVIHCSTVGVASGDGSRPCSEQAPYSPPPNDKYEVTKCEGEIAALDFYRHRGLPVAVIRPAQVYGPGDRRKAKFYRMVKRGIIVNPGNTMKHLIFIDDLCRAFEMAMLSKEAVGEIFIIAGEKAISLREFIILVARELGVDPPKLKLPAIPITWLCTATENLCNLARIKPPLFRRSMDFFIKSVQFDTSKARTRLGFRSQIDIPVGISKTVAWYQQNKLL